MAVRIPITSRARTYGYVIWPKALDAEIRQVLRDDGEVKVVFEGSDLGSRTVAWKYRRFSVGPSHTRDLSESLSVFELSSPSPGWVDVRCL